MGSGQVDKSRVALLRAEVRAIARGLATEVMNRNRPQHIRRLRTHLESAKAKLASETGTADIVTSPLPTQEETGLESQ